MANRDAILAAVNLQGLADDLLGARIGAMSSPAWRCPDAERSWHADASVRTTTFLTRRGEQRWHCHGCGTGGTAIDLVMKRHGVGVRQSLDLLAARTGAAAPSPPPPAEERGVQHDGPPRPARTPLDAWAAHAARLLWQPYGEPVLRWLVDDRGIPADVLRANCVGATAITPDHVLPTRRAVAGPRSASPAAVLPVIARNQAIHAQLRLIAPRPGEPRYLNPTGTTTRHPPLALYRPPKRLHPEILITEGILDALAANAAGYRAAAVLSPGRADAEVAVHLSRLNGPLVLALDPDGPGDGAAARLEHHLIAHGRRPVWLPALDGDLNDALVSASDWPRKLSAHVRHVVAVHSPHHGPTLGAG